MGSETFAQQFLKRARAGKTEAAETNRLARAERMEWPELVKRAERLLGCPWTTMLEAHRDWGQAHAVMEVVVRHGRHVRHRWSEVVRRIEGLKYPAGAQAVRRFGERIASNLEMSRFVGSLRRELKKGIIRGSNVNCLDLTPLL